MVPLMVSHTPPPQRNGPTSPMVPALNTRSLHPGDMNHLGLCPLPLRIWASLPVLRVVGRKFPTNLGPRRVSERVGPGFLVFPGCYLRTRLGQIWKALPRGRQSQSGGQMFCPCPPRTHTHCMHHTVRCDRVSAPIGKPHLNPCGDGKS